MQLQCLAITNKGNQCSKKCSGGNLTCNIQSHVEQFHNPKMNTKQHGG